MKSRQSHRIATLMRPAGQEIVHYSLVFLLCCSCAPLVFLVFSHGALGGTTLAPGSLFVSLTAAVQSVFKGICIFSWTSCRSLSGPLAEAG